MQTEFINEYLAMSALQLPKLLVNQFFGLFPVHVQNTSTNNFPANETGPLACLLFMLTEAVKLLQAGAEGESCIM